MKTIMYLLRHGATAINATKPYKLQGSSIDGPLAELGLKQSELTRELLADTKIENIYSSPMKRAVQTAEIVARPHGLKVQEAPEFVECDVGRWEGLTWAEIEDQYPDEYRAFMDDPGKNPYFGGESFGDVAARTGAALERLFKENEGKSFLVVAHHVVNRVYLAIRLGLTPSHGRQIVLDNCGISIIANRDGVYRVDTFNSVFHLDGIDS